MEWYENLVSKKARRGDADYEIRKACNAVKRALIEQHVRDGDAVLDIGCGKGGDVGKLPRGVRYVGVDSSSTAVEDARERWADLDVHVASFTNPLPPQLLKQSFDVLMCNFAAHYAFGSVEHVSGFFNNVCCARKQRGATLMGVTVDADALLARTPRDPPHKFGSSLFSVEFDQAPNAHALGQSYTFKFSDRVDAREYIVPWKVFHERAIAADFSVHRVANALDFCNIRVSENTAEYLSLFRVFVYKN